MKISARLPFILMLAIAASTAAAGAAAPEKWTPPPGWASTRGGDAGREILVTTTAPAGPGSIAAAIEAEGPRKVVFAVAGIIDLEGRRLVARNPHLTIAGETAPSPGITLIQGGISVVTHDVIVRHLRIRPGASRAEPGSRWDIDGLNTSSGAHDVIVDHCSISWATDENLSASGPRFRGESLEDWRRNTSHRITFSNCIIAEALHQSTHSKETGHSKGSLIHDNATGIAIIGNLYISNHARNPLFKGGVRGAVVNNYIHNAGGFGFTHGLVPEQWVDREWERAVVTVVGNVVRKGPSTPPDAGAVRFGSNWGTAFCDAYVHDNRLLDRQGDPLPEILSVYSRPGLEQPWTFRLLDHPPVWPENLTAMPAAEVVEHVLANAGARPWERDAVDRRLIEEARTGGGRLIDTELEVGGYDVLNRQ